MSVCLLLNNKTNPLSLPTSWGHRKGDYCHNYIGFPFFRLLATAMTTDNDLYVTTYKKLFVTTLPCFLNIDLGLSLLILFLGVTHDK